MVIDHTSDSNTNGGSRKSKFASSENDLMKNNKLFKDCGSILLQLQGTNAVRATNAMVEQALHGCGDFVSGMNGNLMIGGLDGAEIYNLTIKDTYTKGGYGIKFWAGGYYKNLKIHDCVINVNETAMAWESNFCIELWNVGEGCEIYNVEANTVFSLISKKIAIAGDFSKNLKVHHCAFINNNREGGSNNEAVEADVSNMEFYNNYMENASIGLAFWYKTQYVSIHDNIFRITKEMSQFWGGLSSTGIMLPLTLIFTVTNLST